MILTLTGISCFTMDVDTVTTELSSPAPDLPSSDPSDCSTTSQLVTMPLSAQTSISTVPAMPNADTPPSLPFPKSEFSTLFISTTHQDHAQHGITSSMRGTPFTGANCGAWQPILPGSVSGVGPGTPFWNGYLALTPSIPSTNHNIDGARKCPTVSNRLLVTNITDSVIIWINRMC